MELLIKFFQLLGMSSDLSKKIAGFNTTTLLYFVISLLGITSYFMYQRWKHKKENKENTVLLDSFSCTIRALKAQQIKLVQVRGIMGNILKARTVLLRDILNIVADCFIDAIDSLEALKRINYQTITSVIDSTFDNIRNRMVDTGIPRAIINLYDNEIEERKAIIKDEIAMIFSIGDNAVSNAQILFTVSELSRFYVRIICKMDKNLFSILNGSISGLDYKGLKIEGLKPEKEGQNEYSEVF